jgi:hypothetical protein
MGQIDVLYMTRVQKERFPSQAEYDAVKDVFKITPETMAMVGWGWGWSVGDCLCGWMDGWVGGWPTCYFSVVGPVCVRVYA